MRGKDWKSVYLCGRHLKRRERRERRASVEKRRACEARKDKEGGRLQGSYCFVHSASWLNMQNPVNCEIPGCQNDAIRIAPLFRGKVCWCQWVLVFLVKFFRPFAPDNGNIKRLNKKKGNSIVCKGVIRLFASLSLPLALSFLLRARSFYPSPSTLPFGRKLEINFNNDLKQILQVKTLIHS